MWTDLNHDPFARTSTIRASVATHRACDWCGQRRKSGRLFCYRVRGDGALRPQIPMRSSDKLFCSLDCAQTFYA